MFDRLRQRLRQSQDRASDAANAPAEPPPIPDEFIHAPDAEPEDVVGKKVGFHGNELPDRGPQSGWGGGMGTGV